MLAIARALMSRPEAAAVRRAEPRARTADHQGAVQDHRRPQRTVEHRRAARRAERQPRRWTSPTASTCSRRGASSPAATPTRSPTTTASARRTWGTDMDRFFEAVFLGLSSGAIYALVALGLVVVFRGTGHLNFAAGRDGDAVGLRRLGRDDVDALRRLAGARCGWRRSPAWCSASPSARPPRCSSSARWRRSRRSPCSSP